MLLSFSVPLFSSNPPSIYCVIFQNFMAVFAGIILFHPIQGQFSLIFICVQGISFPENVIHFFPGNRLIDAIRDRLKTEAPFKIHLTR